MKLTRVIALAVIAASCGLGVAQAKTLRDAGQPAEFPPSSYTGRQYVDSAGCVFVRAGIDGDVAWVPRVTRARKTLCGQRPTLASAPKSQPQPQVAPAPKPKVAAQVPQPAPKRVVRSKPVRVAAQPAPQVAAQPVATKVRRLAAPVLAPAAPPAAKPVATKVRRTVAAAPACAGASAISSRYTGTKSGYAVRCGPQTASHVTRVPGTRAERHAPRALAAPSYAAPSYDTSGYRVATAAAAPQAVPAYEVRTTPAVRRASGTKRIVRVDPHRVRVAPRHVAQAQARAAQGITIPDGYKRVWTDGRLNPHRAHQTFAGKARMEMMWTSTLPRRLIMTDTGRDMAQHYPGLIYPYTSYEQQRAAMSAPSAVPQQKVILSTKSRQPEARVAAPKAAKAKPIQGGASYVQAGVFTTRAQAQQAAQRLAGAGLSARLGSMTRGGTRYSLLLSGPYASAQAAQGALARARSAGFANARLR